VKAIRVNVPGGLEVLKHEEVQTPEPAPGQVQVKVEAVGVNFIDVYQRTGFYKVPLPLTLGQEGAGIVQKTGTGVKGLKQGDRVAWAGAMGSYAEYLCIAADRLVPIPADISTQDAAAAMLQGMTAHYLACSTYPLKPGDVCLVHAAAGGVGGLLIQIALMRGARVIATVGSEVKVKLVREYGIDDVIQYRKADVAAEVRKLTGGKLCNVVYDGVGRDTWQSSLASTAPRGLLCLFGQASGGIGTIDPLVLSDGSKYMTRAKLADYITTPEELAARAGQVLGWIGAGKLKLRIYQTYPLKDAADAHRDLESGTTSGKLILLPG
jgi:NADPH2:quinone reductase